VFPGDVTDGARVAAIVREIDATLGRIDVLVNNAGIVWPHPWPHAGRRDAGAG
jgi:NAD(P)-dependent dehydrogenase (short-subunit alcohol dehydrogenase family)